MSPIRQIPLANLLAHVLWLFSQPSLDGVFKRGIVCRHEEILALAGGIGVRLYKITESQQTIRMLCKAARRSAYGIVSGDQKLTNLS